MVIGPAGALFRASYYLGVSTLECRAWVPQLHVQARLTGGPRVASFSRRSAQRSLECRGSGY